MIKLKGEIDKSTIIFGNYTTIDRTSRQEIKDIEELNTTTNQQDLVFI